MLLLGRGKGNHDRFARISERLFHTEIGCTILSALFGVALAFMFQRVCKGQQCYVAKSPPSKDISKYVYEIEGEGCFKYTPKVVSCNGDDISSDNEI